MEENKSIYKRHHELINEALRYIKSYLPVRFISPVEIGYNETTEEEIYCTGIDENGICYNDELNKKYDNYHFLSDDYLLNIVNAIENNDIITDPSLDEKQILKQKYYHDIVNNYYMMISDISKEGDEYYFQILKTFDCISRISELSYISANRVFNNISNKVWKETSKEAFLNNLDENIDHLKNFITKSNE